MNAGCRRLLSALFPLVLAVAVSLPAWADGAAEIPAGTTIRVRMIDKLSSEQSQVGDTFHATLEEPITVNGRDLYPKGADVVGRVTDVHKTGSLTEPGELDLVLATVSSGTIATSIRVQPLVIKGESHTKSNTTKIGGGAALGAIIGAIAGGGKGAAIGTVAGAAAGTGAAAVTGKKPAIVESEAVLAFVTSTSSVATNLPPSATDDRGSVSSDPDAPPVRKTSASGTAETVATAAMTPEGGVGPLFSLRDRRIIRSCVSEHVSDFPPGATQRPELPPGSDRQIRRGETLSSDAQKQVQSLPLACEQQLPGLPGDYERVVYNGRVLLIDGSGRIRDMFYLDDQQ